MPFIPSDPSKIGATELRPSNGERYVNFTCSANAGHRRLTNAIAITVENSTIDGNTLGQYAIPRVRQRLASGFCKNEYAPRFIVVVKDDGMVRDCGWGRLEFASPNLGDFCLPASTGNIMDGDEEVSRVPGNLSPD